MSLTAVATNQTKEHNSEVALEIFGEKRREKQFPRKKIFQNQVKVGTR